MPIELTKPETAEIIPSLQRFFSEEFELDLNDMRASHVLNYIMQEIAPFAYNKGVKDSEAYLRTKVDDLPAMCFEGEMMYWKKRKR